MAGVWVSEEFEDGTAVEDCAGVREGEISMTTERYRPFNEANIGKMITFTLHRVEDSGLPSQETGSIVSGEWCDGEWIGYVVITTLITDKRIEGYRGVFETTDGQWELGVFRFV